MADELEMSSQRRLLTAMRCKQPDRIPIHVRGVRAWDDEWVASRDVSYKPLIDAVREHCDWVVGWGVSAGWFLTAFPELHIETQVHDAGDWVLHETIAHTPKGPLTHIRKVSKHDYPPLTHKFWVTCEEDLERFLSVPYVPPEPDVQSFFDLTRRIGERGIVMVSLLDPIGYVHDLLGSELLAIWSIERRDIIMQLVEMFTQRLYELISYLIARGVRGVFG
ncbi:MAG TPA: hypothetical protein EYP10_03230, partial [Armatimonadetes bacterium]|nr:hypothetical protein [Armatimonadota bacterium]